MNIAYDKKINKTYVTISGNELCSASDNSHEINTNNYVERMLLENTIPGFVQGIEFSSSEVSCTYDVTSYMGIEEYVKENKIDSNLLMNFIKSMIVSSDNVDEYLISYESIYFDIPFINREDRSIKYVIYPYDNLGGNESLKRLADILIEHVDYSDELATFGVYEFYDMVNKNNFEFTSLLTRIVNKKNERLEIENLEEDEPGLEEDTDTICAINNNSKRGKNMGIVVFCSVGILVFLALFRVF